MKQLIEDFTKHLSESVRISDNTDFVSPTTTINNVLICGLGGSGIGGTIISQVTAEEAKFPITINKDYKIPDFVNSNTLVICCSYSGNTEETLEMLEQAQAKKAEIACLTSGGRLEEIAKKKSYNHIVVPGGNPPRAAFGLTFPALFFLLYRYEVISNGFIANLNKSIELIDEEENNILKTAREITEMLYQKIPVIYADAWYEGVAIRFRQQINENAKTLCWHHVIPEMNHNELVGWTKKNDDLAVVLFRNENDYFRTQKRMEINKTVLQKYTSTIVEIFSKGDSRLERSLYLIHLGDWISFFLAEKNNVDVVEINVINHLKSELAKI